MAVGVSEVLQWRAAQVLLALPALGAAFGLLAWAVLFGNDPAQALAVDWGWMPKVALLGAGLCVLAVVAIDLHLAQSQRPYRT